jgi:hypothetical protein
MRLPQSNDPSYTSVGRHNPLQGKRLPESTKQPLVQSIASGVVSPEVLGQAANSYGMDAPTLNGIDVPKWKC